MIQQPRKLKKIEDEEWRELQGSNGRYFVSNYGRIKSYVINKTEGEILKSADINGFKYHILVIDNVKKSYYAHRLVAEVWLEKPSEAHNYVVHLDGNLKNNHASNLEWHTKETLYEKRREIAKLKGKPARPAVPHNAKLKESDIRLLKTMLKRGVLQSQIAKMFRISEMQVTRIKRGENWGHVQV